MTSIMKRHLIESHFDAIAQNYDFWKQKNAYYYDTIRTFIARSIPEGSRVFEIGCGTGEILASMKPGVGFGVDISAEMVKIAKEKYPQYTFIHSAIEDFQLDETFDYIIMVDVIDHVCDILKVFENVHQFCHPTTRIILTTANPWWDPILSIAEKLGAKMPEGPHNFIEKSNLSAMIDMMDYSVSYSGYLLLLPKYIPIISYLTNSLGVRLWPIKKLSCVQYMIIQPMARNEVSLGLKCSVIVPCYNEEDNIEEAVRGIPQMGKETEIIVVNDGSTDGTTTIIKSLQREYNNLKLIEYEPNCGKGYAIQQGFKAATNEVLITFDADMSVPHDELPRFFNMLDKGICQFVNGSRMIYPIESQAMRTLGLFGNKLFSLILSFIIQQNITDTLCGTKALYKKDFERMRWGLDKRGNFDLLFEAAMIGNKIMEIPIHYQARQSGERKSKTFLHGLQLLKACVQGFRKLVLDPKR